METISQSSTSENLLRTIIESVPSGILLVDLEGKIVLCNSELEKMFGYNHQELLGKKIEILVPLPARDKHPSLRLGFGEHPSKRQMGAGRNLTGLKKDQTEIPVEIGLNHVQIGDHMHVIAAVVDITDRIKQEEKFRTIVDSVPNGILMTNIHGQILLTNTPLEKMFGYEKDELIGSPIETLVPARFSKNHPQYRSDFAKEPHKRQMGAGRDLSGLKKDKSEIPVEIGLNHMTVGSERFLLASVVDITERKHTEKKLHKAYAEVQQKNQEMEQFVYTVSHDLKSPLVTSGSFMDFLKEDLQAKKYDSVPDSLIRIEKAHRRMQELIEDLLQLSRVGRLELQEEEVNLNEMFQEIYSSLSSSIKEKNIDYQVQDFKSTIKGDARRIYQVFENLVVNAIKYASDITHPTIQVFSLVTETESQICIKDNGPGIEPQYHEKIFGLFQRLDNTKEGTGVGLAIVSRIMQLHGGRCWIQSTPPNGCEFWVAFPKERTELAYGQFK